MSQFGWVQDIAQSTGRGNKDAATQEEVYIIEGAPHPQKVIQNPENFVDTSDRRLPAIGTPHPENPSLLLDVYDARCDGAVTIARALYSVDAQFALPPVDPSDTDTIVGYQSSFEQVTVRIPYAQRTPIVVPVVGPPGADGLPALSRTYGWVPKFRQISEWRFTQTWTVLILPNQRDQANAAIWSQQDKLHKINGVWVRYRGTGLTETTVNGRELLQLKHSWTRDGGTLFPTTTAPRPGGPTFGSKFFLQLWPITLLEPTAPPFTTPGWLRPPFQSVTFTEPDTILATPTDPTAIPDAHLVLDFSIGNRKVGSTYNGDGWKDLPGTSS